MNGSRLFLANALGSLVIATAAVAAYHFAFASPRLKFALVDVNDVFYLINFLFTSGAAPR